MTLQEWLNKEIKIYNSYSPRVRMITKISLVYFIITLLSHVRIIVL